MKDIEGLGVFYLGREYDLSKREATTEPFLYESKDLLTHAVCVGMTGSGKTGLCISLIEEAAIDRVPVLVIDPKGDLTNLCLTFPELRPDDFAPWVAPDDAERQQLSVPQLAERQAQQWRDALTEWGQDGARIGRLRQAVDIAIYTPGSTAGLPLSVLHSLDVPPADLLGDPELLQSSISAVVSGLLGLLNVDADPIQSREHILLSTLITTAWQAGRGLDLSALIAQIQKPPITKVGVLDLDAFFPAKERAALAMRLNNLLAAPAFAPWLAGEPLSVDRLLFTPDGKPRVAVISIAHLSDSERMFFVSLLFSQVLAWMRTQSGTTSLRALMYMDEIAGYFPPVANPPSKPPLLTLLKQARAFGLGIVLATQNPVDIDYKGLSNTGTWFIGRLQTEQDCDRLIEGLEGALTQGKEATNRTDLINWLTSLEKRVFLVHNVHDDAPRGLKVRCTLSYLRGPLNRAQIKQLVDPQRAASQPAASAKVPSHDGDASVEAPKAAATNTAASTTAVATPIGDSAAADAGTPPNADNATASAGNATAAWLKVRAAKPAEARLVYRAMILGRARVRLVNAKLAIEVLQPVAWLASGPQPDMDVDWSNHQALLAETLAIDNAPAEGSVTETAAGDLPAGRRLASFKKSFAENVYRAQVLRLWNSPASKLISKAGESERDFRIRLQQAFREKRDELVEQVQAKFAKEVEKLAAQRLRAQAVLDQHRQQSRHQVLDAILSVGGTIVKGFFGRRSAIQSTVTSATSAARKFDKAASEATDVHTAEARLAEVEQQQAELDAKLKAEKEKLLAASDPLVEVFESIEIKPRRADIEQVECRGVWAPYWENSSGERVAAWL